MALGHILLVFRREGNRNDFLPTGPYLRKPISGFVYCILQIPAILVLFSYKIQRRKLSRVLSFKVCVAKGERERGKERGREALEK